MYGQLVPPYTPIGFSIRWFDEFLTALAKKNNGSSLRFHTPHYIRWLYELMDVQEGNASGEYYGKPKTPGYTLDAASISGDYNKVHVGDGDVFAHGFHGVTEALEALRLYHATHSIELRPKGIDIQFRKKVPLDGNRLRHKILPFHVGEAPCMRAIKTFTATNATAGEEQKPAISIDILLEEGPFERKFLGYNLYCGWRTSALLAQTWPGCIFYKLTAAFGELLKEDSIRTTVRIIDSYETVNRSEQKQRHLIVATDAGTFKGEADIILPIE